MRLTTSLIVFGFIALLGIVGAGATYAVGASTRDEIADGIRVQGVDVGGLTAAQAEAKLKRELVDPLARPVRLKAGGKTFTLSARKARIGIDIAGTVAEALGRSREGSAVSRVIRTVKGERLDLDLAVRTTYSKAAIRDLVERAEQAMYRAPRDAKVDVTASGVATVASEKGRALVTRGLEGRIRSRLLAYSGSRTIRARIRAVEPKVSTADLAEKHPAILIVNRNTFKLDLYKNLKLHKTYGVAVGKVGMDTPAGLYTIANKAVNPAWHVPDSEWAGELAGKVIPGDDPTNPIKARWLGIYDGVGIHGTSDEGSIGSAASHGCVRMRVSDVKELYPQVPVGAPIYIA